jgi:hypothetical protein
MPPSGDATFISTRVPHEFPRARSSVGPHRPHSTRPHRTRWTRRAREDVGRNDRCDGVWIVRRQVRRRRRRFHPPGAAVALCQPRRRTERRRSHLETAVAGHHSRHGVVASSLRTGKQMTKRPAALPAMTISRFRLRLLAYDLWGRDREKGPDYPAEKRFCRRAGQRRAKQN